MDDPETLATIFIKIFIPFNRFINIFFFSSTVQGDSLLIDSSTIDPAVSQEMSALALEKSSNYVDAPVSGGNNRLIDQSLCAV